MHRHLISGLWLGVLLCCLSPVVSRAAPPLPPKPARHVSDGANIIPPADEQRLVAKLEQFERDTSNQVLVATFPRIPDGTYLEEFTVKTAEAWGAGAKAQDNGIILFVFLQDRQMRIEVGYGLEGAVPDSIAASIIANILKPRFRANDYAGGIDQAVEAIFKATRGEYEGSGRTIAEGRRQKSAGGSWVLLLIPLIFIFSIIRNARKALIDGPHHRRHYEPPTPWWFGGGGFGGSSGGGFGRGGFGGGFSGGGGSFGGGGASGDW